MGGEEALVQNSLAMSQVHTHSAADTIWIRNPQSHPSHLHRNNTRWPDQTQTPRWRRHWRCLLPAARLADVGLAAPVGWPAAAAVAAAAVPPGGAAALPASAAAQAAAAAAAAAALAAGPLHLCPP